MPEVRGDSTANRTGEPIPAPRLHWIWVLVLGLLTGFIFPWVWLIVQSNWSRRVRGRSVAFPLAIGLLIAQLCFLFAGESGGGFLILFGFYIGGSANGVIAGLWLVAVALRITNVFILRSELQSEPISIPLSVVMTLLFGPIYFQYHLRDYSNIDAELKALNRCDGCKVTFHNFYGLTKVEGRGFLCEKCRAEMAQNSASN